MDNQCVAVLFRPFRKEIFGIHLMAERRCP